VSPYLALVHNKSDPYPSQSLNRSLQSCQLEPDIKPPSMHSVEPKPMPMPLDDSHVSKPPTKPAGDAVAPNPPSWSPDDTHESKAPTMLPDDAVEPKPPSLPPDYLKCPRC